MVAHRFQARVLRLDLIALLRAHEPEHPLTLQYRGLELMRNPVLERLVTPNPVDALGETARNARASTEPRHTNDARR